MPTQMAGNKGSPSSPPDAGSSTNRLQRNLAEKQRRDKLNGFISELATIVPMVAMASKRLDKTSILRLSAAHLRIYQSSLSGNCKRSKGSFRWRPSFFSNEQIREILESVEGFLLVTTTNGKIMYVSQSVEKFLSHQNIEMIGHSIFSFVHPSDVDMVRTQIQNLCVAVGHKNGSSSASARCSFYCRLRERNQPRSEVLMYQFVHVVGHMTVASPDELGSDNEEKGTKGSSVNHILKAFVRVVHSNPYNELSLADAIEDEYVTRHNPNGTIIFADHRLSTITGHLPHEVYGMSAYEYIVHEDIPVALFAHKLMFSNNGGTGMIVYRLRTRNEGFVYLKSTGYLQFEKSSAQVDHFICVNKQLSNEDGEEELKKFSDHFTPHIIDSSTSSLYESIKTIQVGTIVPLPEIVSKSETKNGNGSDTSAVSSPDDDKLPKVERSNQLMSKEREDQKEGNKTPANNSQNSENTDVQMVWTKQCTYSKRITEKISLESEISGQNFANHSPLTESSFSANSPQSDMFMLSPSEVNLNSIDTVLNSHDTCSSAELSTSPSQGPLRDMADCDMFPCSIEEIDSSPFQAMTSSVSSEAFCHASVFSPNSKMSTSPASPIVSNNDAVAAPFHVWEGSPVTNFDIDCCDSTSIPSSLPVRNQTRQCDESFNSTC